MVGAHARQEARISSRLGADPPERLACYEHARAGGRSLTIDESGGARAEAPICVTCVHMSTHSLRDLRSKLGSVVRTVAATGEEVIITDSGTEVAVIISMTDYERLHEHADVADALRLRDLRARSFTAMTLAEMLDALDVDADAFATR
jgi:antitoxin YefM